MKHIAGEHDRAARPAPNLILALSIILEQKLATLAYKKRMQAAYPAILLGFRQAPSDLFRQRLSEGAVRGDQLGAQRDQQMSAIEIGHRHRGMKRSCWCCGTPLAIFSGSSSKRVFDRFEILPDVELTAQRLVILKARFDH